MEIPFAIITEVTPGSPSHISGITVDDLIVEFHDVNCRNHGNLTKLADSEIEYRKISELEDSS